MDGFSNGNINYMHTLLTKGNIGLYSYSDVKCAP